MLVRCYWKVVEMDAKELLQSFGRIVEELEKLSPDERERVIRAAMTFCEIRISQPSVR